MMGNFQSYMIHLSKILSLFNLYDKKLGSKHSEGGIFARDKRHRGKQW